MNKENILLGGRKNGKTLEHLIKDIKLMSEFSKQSKLDNYVWYVKEEIWQNYKEVLEPKCKEANIKVIPTDFLPKHLLAIYTKELTFEEIQEFIKDKESKERENYNFKNILKGIRI